MGSGANIELGKLVEFYFMSVAGVALTSSFDLLGLMKNLLVP
jgi:hypothetical protein